MKLQQSDLNEAIRKIPLPDNMRELPVSKRGYPVPYFAAKVGDDYDFRVVYPETTIRCMREHLCWICGQSLGTKKAFVVGPMCVVTQTSAEPPSHYTCGQYAAIACPFLSSPRMRRNAVDLPDGAKNPAGIAIMRNPGVTAVLITKTWKPFKDGRGGVLIRMGEPDKVEWYAERAFATRAQVMESINSGLGLLDAECEKEDTIADKEEARAELAHRISETMRWLPSAPPLAGPLPKNIPRKNPWAGDDGTKAIGSLDDDLKF